MRRPSRSAAASFCGSATGATAACASLRGMAAARPRKVVVVTFGGGARDDETFMPDGQENIPHLLNELMPQATFFSQVVNRGILGHYVATASIVTGVYETFNNFAAVSPDNPTVFEYFRKDLKRPATDCWVVAPSNGFARIGESGHRAYGPGHGRGSDPAEASAVGGPIARLRPAALPAPAPRQLRDAALRAAAHGPADRTGSDGRRAQALGGRFRRPTPAASPVPTRCPCTWRST